MATVVPRISIVLDNDALESIKALAKKTKTSVSKICSRLIEKQLEYDEDSYWMKIVQEEEAKDLKTIGHEEFWSKVDIQN